jgi:nucleotide-binding universal stress UspA family protein
MRDIVTGVQSPEAAVRVLDRSLAEAETSHRPLRAVTAWSVTPMIGDVYGTGYSGAYVPGLDLAVTTEQLAAELLDKALRDRHSGRPVTSTAEAVQGDPGRALVLASRDSGLVVVGARSHGAVGSALLGSATGYVLHHSQCPVMVVPETASPGAYSQVVVGVDGEACSASALRWALNAAVRHRCPLRVIHATNFVPLPGPTESYPDYARAARAWLKENLAEVVPDHRDVRISSEVLEGPAAAVLLAAAGPDDLLVVGSRGRGGFTDLVLGSVATQCSTHARGPVVVVRAGQERLGE